MPLPCAWLLLVPLQDAAGDREAADEELRRHDLAGTVHGPATELLAWASPALRRARERAAGAGYALELYVTADASAHASGGADPDSSATRGLLDAVLTVDAGRAFGVEGGTLVVGLQALGGDDGSAEVGVVQAYSNIDAPDDRVQLARLWYEQELSGGATSVRLGKMDANAEFAAVHGAAHFIHSSMGFSPTILGFPSYPDPAYGLSASQRIARGIGVRAGVFDGAGQEGVKTGERGPRTFLGDPSDLFLVGEADAQWGDALRGRAALGLWRHTGDFARFDGGEEDGTAGLYAVVEQRVAAAGRVFDAFLQLGDADPDVAPITRHVGLGASTGDVLPFDREDALGLGMSLAQLSDEPGAGFDEPSELAVELFYGFRLCPGVRLKPDLQYVRDPGGDSDVGDAWILTLRVSASL